MKFLGDFVRELGVMVYMLKGCIAPFLVSAHKRKTVLVECIISFDLKAKISALLWEK